jgi:hypothetical protein
MGVWSILDFTGREINRLVINFFGLFHLIISFADSASKSRFQQMRKELERHSPARGTTQCTKRRKSGMDNKTATFEEIELQTMNRRFQ